MNPNDLPKVVIDKTKFDCTDIQNDTNDDILNRLDQYEKKIEDKENKENKANQENQDEETDPLTEENQENQENIEERVMDDPNEKRKLIVKITRFKDSKFKHLFKDLDLKHLLMKSNEELNNIIEDLISIVKNRSTMKALKDTFYNLNQLAEVGVTKLKIMNLEGYSQALKKNECVDDLLEEIILINNLDCHLRPEYRLGLECIRTMFIIDYINTNKEVSASLKEKIEVDKKFKDL